MLLAHRFAATTASLLIASGLFFAAGDAAAEAASGTCAEAAELTVLPSPVAPWKGAPLRVMVVSEKPVEGALSLIAPDGSVAAKSADRHGGRALFLVRRGRRAGRGDVARDADARPRAGGMQRDHARHRRERAQAGAAAHAGGQLLAGAQ